MKKYLIFAIFFFIWFSQVNATTYSYPQYNGRYIYNDLSSATQFCIEQWEVYSSHLGGINPYNPYYYNWTWQTTGTFSPWITEIICSTPPPPPPPQESIWISIINSISCWTQNNLTNILWWPIWNFIYFGLAILIISIWFYIFKKYR